MFEPDVQTFYFDPTLCSDLSAKHRISYLYTLKRSKTQPPKRWPRFDTKLNRWRGSSSRILGSVGSLLHFYNSPILSDQESVRLRDK